MLRYAGIIYDSVVDGPGIRGVFFTQTCSHHCPGCHNPKTWDKDGGEILTQDEFEKFMTYFEENEYANLTMSGGDTLDNLSTTNFVIREFKRRFPKRNIWLYTGYKIEDIIKEDRYLEVLKLCNVVVDGPFIVSLRTSECPFRGSSNQRLIDIQKTFEKGEIILYEK